MIFNTGCENLVFTLTELRSHIISDHLHKSGHEPMNINDEERFIKTYANSKIGQNNKLILIKQPKANTKPIEVKTKPFGK